MTNFRETSMVLQPFQSHLMHFPISREQEYCNCSAFSFIPDIHHKDESNDVVTQPTWTSLTVLLSDGLWLGYDTESFTPSWLSGNKDFRNVPCGVRMRALSKSWFLSNWQIKAVRSSLFLVKTWGWHEQKNGVEKMPHTKVCLSMVKCFYKRCLGTPCLLPLNDF